MKVTVCQLDNRPGFLEPMLEQLAQHCKQESSEFLLLPEMCFSEWLAADPEPNAWHWLVAVQRHEKHIAQLDQLGPLAIMGTRPIVHANGSFRNQAYLWSADRGPQAVHEKYYLPDEDSYWEKTWYDRGQRSFEIARALGARIGVQICTEMWFFEWARHYARARADILCVPRATPHGTAPKWLSGGQAAAVCSGAFCLSSNLWNPPGSRADLGGLGWIIDPDGAVIATTSAEKPFATAEIDLDFAVLSKNTYPRYVSE